MIKKLLLSAAFAVLAAGAASAQVFIGETQYNSLSDAVAAASTTEQTTITIKGEIETGNSRVNVINAAYNIKFVGEDNAVIKRSTNNKGNLLMLINQATVSFENIIFDGQSVEGVSKCMIEIGDNTKGANVTISNCQFRNIIFDYAVQVKNKGVLTLNNVSESNNTFAENRGLVFVGNNNVTLGGTANYAIYVEKSLFVKAAADFAGVTTIYLDAVRDMAANDGKLVQGCTNPAFVNVSNAPAGYSLNATNGNLALEKSTVKNETTGVYYPTLSAAVAAAQSKDVLVVLENITLSGRVLNSIDNLTIKGATPEVTITKTYENGLMFAAEKRNLILIDLVLDCNNKKNDKNELEAGGAHLTLNNIKILNSVTAQALVNVKSSKTLYANNVTKENCSAANDITLAGKMEINGNNNLAVNVSNTAEGAIFVPEGGALTNEEPIELTLPAGTEAGKTVVSGTVDYRKFALTNEGLYLKPDFDKKAVVTSNEVYTGINDVVVDENAPVEYYNLQGVRVANPEAGQLYIRRQGGKATKVLVK